MSITEKVIATSTAGKNAIMNEGATINITLDYTSTPDEKLTGFFAMPVIDSSGNKKYIVMEPCVDLQAGSSGATIKGSSATEAAKVDPSSAGNSNWNAYVTYWDAGNNQFYDAAGCNREVSSVSGVDITIASGFTDDPGADDYVFPTTDQNAAYELGDMSDIVYIPDSVNFDEANGDIEISALFAGTLKYESLRSAVQTMIDNDIINTERNNCALRIVKTE